ncbi:MAG: double-strand break repair protein AddB, partial [Rhizobiales bacterium]|nr:double-strand break repair protein AddB [Hyphomicrobiales bacterium]
MSEARSFIHPRVATIGPQHAFLDCLIKALFAGNIVPGFEVNRDAFAKNPFLIADLTLYLPTRRAVRAAEAAFVKAISDVLGTSGPNAALLPTIRAIGDTDEADLMFQQSSDDPLAIIAALPPALPELERHVILTQLVWSWSKALIRKIAPMEPYEAVIIPANPADAAYLASNLASLLDEAENQGVDWRELETLVPDDFAVYWQLSLDFLKIVTSAWPQHLAQCGMIDGMARRNLLIRAKAKALSELGAQAGPTIAAGSTGSVPATAELLKTIAELPQGAVVLPGLDLNLDDDAWAAIGTQQMAIDGDPAALGHPQASLKQTLSHLRLSRDDVINLTPDDEGTSADRFRLLNEALRPAEATQSWPSFLKEFGEDKVNSALDGVTLIEARGPQEEALSIALVLREALEQG